MKNKILRLEASVLIAVILACSLNMVSFAKQCDSIRNKMLRMHVIANSDSEKDQELKLKVRDAVLLAGKEVFDGSITADEAQEKIIPHISYLEQVAKKVIIENGFDYDVNITVQKEFFDTRVYDNSVTLPAGYYTAVKVIIGEGEGKNWWCVMFPPMCLPTVSSKGSTEDVLNSQENEIVTNSGKYKVRFKIVEWYERYIKN